MSAAYVDALFRAAGWAREPSFDEGRIEATPRPHARFERWPGDVGGPEWEEILAEADAPPPPSAAPTVPRPTSQPVAAPPAMPTAPGVVPAPVAPAGVTAEPPAGVRSSAAVTPTVVHARRAQPEPRESSARPAHSATRASDPLPPTVTRREANPADRDHEPGAETVATAVEAGLAPHVPEAPGAVGPADAADRDQEAKPPPAAVFAMPKSAAREAVAREPDAEPDAAASGPQPLIVEIGLLEIRLDAPAVTTPPPADTTRRAPPVVSLAEYLAGVTGGLGSQKRVP